MFHHDPALKLLKTTFSSEQKMNYSVYHDDSSWIGSCRFPTFGFQTRTLTTTPQVVHNACLKVYVLQSNIHNCNIQKASLGLNLSG